MPDVQKKEAWRGRAESRGNEDGALAGVLSNNGAFQEEEFTVCPWRGA